jgi:hypothetical protein
MAARTPYRPTASGVRESSLGPPAAYEHLHNPSFDFFRLGRTELSIAKGRVAISIPEVISDLWIKQVE